MLIAAYHSRCPQKVDINAVPMKVTDTFSASNGRQVKEWICTKCGESVLTWETTKDDSKT